MFILTHFVKKKLCALYIFRASEIYVRIFSFYGSHPCMLLIVLWLHLIKVHQYVGKSWSCTFFVHDNRYVEVYCLWYENFFFFNCLRSTVAFSVLTIIWFPHLQVFFKYIYGRVFFSFLSFLWLCMFWRSGSFFKGMFHHIIQFDLSEYCLFKKTFWIKLPG